MLIDPILYPVFVHWDGGPIIWAFKIICLLFGHTDLSFITSGWLLAKQGKILTWALIQGQGDNFNEFHWELAKWASVPFVFSILSKPGSLSYIVMLVWVRMMSCVLLCFFSCPLLQWRMGRNLLASGTMA